MQPPISMRKKRKRKEGFAVLDDLFTGILDSTATASLTLRGFLICMAVALVAGMLLALAYTYKNTYTKSFVIALAMLPAVVCVIIMMVSGSLGAGVAVAGTFSLVRFRSLPGTAREICAIFLAMAAGLAAGMGYIGFAFLFVVLMMTVSMLYTRMGFGERRNAQLRKTLRITVPEELDYGEIFEDLFEKYTSEHTLQCVKTTNMGSLFRLTYHLTLRGGAKEKDFIDDLRCRNGNLEISSSVQSTVENEL